MTRIVENDAAVGVVVAWQTDEGWGLIESSSLDGLVWAHYSAVAMQGYRTLEVGATVTFTWEKFPQDGYRYRAIRVTRPSGDVDDSGPSFARGEMSSVLRLQRDHPVQDAYPSPAELP